MVGNGSPQAQAGSGGCVARRSLSNQPRGSEIPYCRSRARRADLARGSPARQSLVRWRTAAERSSRIQAAARAAADRPLRPRQRIGRLRAHRRRPCAGGRCRCAGSYRPRWRAARACKPGAGSRHATRPGRVDSDRHASAVSATARAGDRPSAPMRGPRSASLRPTSSSSNRAVASAAGARSPQRDCDRPRTSTSTRGCSGCAGQPIRRSRSSSQPVSDRSGPPMPEAGLGPVGPGRPIRPGQARRRAARLPPASMAKLGPRVGRRHPKTAAATAVQDSRQLGLAHTRSLRIERFATVLPSHLWTDTRTTRG